MGRARQVRVVRGMDDSWLLYEAHVMVEARLDCIPADIRLIHPAAAKDCPPHWDRIEDRDAVRAILAQAREVMDDPKLQRGVLKAIRKRKEIQRRDRVATRAVIVANSIRDMLSAGATHEEVMDAVNAALVAAVQNS